MRNSKNRPAAGLLFFIIFLASGCQYDQFQSIDDIDYSADFAIPLINSQININEILNEAESLSQLQVEEDGQLTFFYENASFEQGLEDIVEQTTDFPFAVSDTNVWVPFDAFAGISPREISLKSGSIVFEIQSQFNEDVQLIIRLPGMLKNGVPFSVSTNLTYKGSSPFIVSTADLPVADYKIILPDGKLNIIYEARLNSGERVVLNRVAGQVKNWQIKKAEGYWGYDTFKVGVGSTQVDLYDNWKGGELYFENPTLSLKIQNSFGIPLRVLLKSLYVLTLDGQRLSLESELLASGFDLPYPAIHESGSSKSATFTFDKANSNIDALFNARFTEVHYELEAIINPADENELGFVTDLSKLATGIQIELPIYGTAKDFEMHSIADIAVDDLESIREAELKLITDNGLPIDVVFQLYLLNDQEEVIDSIFSTKSHLLKSAIVDSNGNVAQSSRHTQFIPLSPLHLGFLKQFGKMRLEAGISTFHNGHTSVRIMDYYELDVKMGLKVGIE